MTSTSTSPGAATGSGRSPYFRTSGPPNCSKNAAFIWFLASRSVVNLCHSRHRAAGRTICGEPAAAPKGIKVDLPRLAAQGRWDRLPPSRRLQKMTADFREVVTMSKSYEPRYVGDRSSAGAAIVALALATPGYAQSERHRSRSASSPKPRPSPARRSRRPRNSPPTRSTPRAASTAARSRSSPTTITRRPRKRCAPSSAPSTRITSTR